eukprot:11294634-Prorocentrum_lima.AAC.1
MVTDSGLSRRFQEGSKRIPRGFRNLAEMKSNLPAIARHKQLTAWERRPHMSRSSLYACRQRSWSESDAVSRLHKLAFASPKMHRSIC